MQKTNFIKVSLKELLKNEAYIGEPKTNRNSKNTKNVFAIRNNIDIIDLQKTLEGLEPVLQLVTDTIANYEQILVIAQHPNLQKLEYPQPLLTSKWIHGAFSNFKTVRQSKKHTFFKRLNRLPGLVILLHTTNPKIILNETKYLEIPTVAFVDTGQDPSSAYYVVPSNNKTDTVISLYLKLIAKAIFYGYAKRVLKLQKNTQ